MEVYLLVGINNLLGPQEIVSLSTTLLSGFTEAWSAGSSCF